MYCIKTSTLMLLIAMLGLSIAAKLASRLYQKHVYSFVDEDAAIGWQNRVALAGLVVGFLNYLSHIDFSAS